jgi:hypothetical protein
MHYSTKTAPGCNSDRARQADTGPLRLSPPTTFLPRCHSGGHSCAVVVFHRLDRPKPVQSKFVLLWQNSNVTLVSCFVYSTPYTHCSQSTARFLQVYASRPGALQSPRIEVPVRRYDAMESGRWDTNEIRAVIFDGVGVCW